MLPESDERKSIFIREKKKKTPRKQNEDTSEELVIELKEQTKGIRKTFHICEPADIEHVRHFDDERGQVSFGNISDFMNEAGASPVKGGKPQDQRSEDAWF